MVSFDMNSLKIFTDGPLPLLASVYDQLKIGEIIDQTVNWDKERCGLSPGTAMKSLILNLIVARQPLYLVQEFYKDKDIHKLFGNEITLEQINEFCIGRTLDKVFEANAKVLYSTIAFQTMNIENIQLKSVHWDTTSKNLCGDYDVYTDDDVANPQGPVHITHGYSKDKRFDLKQIKFGLAVTREKIPLFADIMNGNLDDKSWNGDIIESISGALKYLNLQDVLHIADSAMVTKDNLQTMKDSEYKFISRLPGTFQLEKQLIARAISQRDQWIDLGQISGKKDGASYRIQEIKDELYGKPYRFVVCHSDHLDAKKQKTLEATVTKEEKELMEQYKKYVNKEGYYCESDAVSTIQKLKDKLKTRYHKLDLWIRPEEVKKKQATRGRPKKDQSVEYEKRYFVEAKFEKNTLILEKLEDEAGTFVLMTNQLNETKLSTEEVLSEYKNQHSVENTFRMLKSPSYVDAIFLKKPERIEAFGYMMVVGVMLLNVIERRVRKELAKDEEEPIQLTGRRTSKSPTINTILEVFEQVSIVQLPKEMGGAKMLGKAFTENQKRILKLCGVDESIYVRSGKTTDVAE